MKYNKYIDSQLNILIRQLKDLTKDSGLDIKLLIEQIEIEIEKDRENFLVEIDEIKKNE
jgi:hypothetical protein